MNKVVHCRRDTYREKLNNVQENVSHCHFVHHKSHVDRRGPKNRAAAVISCDRSASNTKEIHCPLFPDNEKSIDFFWRFLEPSLVLLIRIVMDSTDEMIMTRKDRSTLRKNLC